MNRLKSAVCAPLLVGLVLIFTLVPSQGYAASSEPASLSSDFPISFEPNLGQTDAQVRFLTRNRRFRMYLTGNSTVLDIAGDKSGHAVALRTAFSGANPSAQVSGGDRRSSVSNYLVGPQAKWTTNVPNYAKVRYEAIYPGIDLLYYGSPRGLEYDFAVAAKADPSAIALMIEGADIVRVNSEGELVLQTGAGEIRW